MNKTFTIILITLLSVIAITLIVGLTLLIKNDFKFDSNFKLSSGLSNKLIEEKEINEIKDLDINSDVADINIEEKNINNIKVELYSNNSKLHQIVEEENKIKVVLKNKKKSIFNFGTKTPNIKIYVPNSYSNKILIDSRVGDTRIKNLKDSSLIAKSDVGDIKIDEIDKIDIKSRIGDIKINNVNDVKIKTSTGDIKIDQVNNLLDIESRTGDIKINNANIKVNSKIKSNTGDIKIKKTSGCYVEGKTNVGDNDIENNDRKSDIVLKIKNNFGDIEVN